MNHFKLVALDMDGTLLNEEKEISAANRKAVAAALEKGVHLVLSTGRFITSTREYARSLGLSSFLITSNGSEIRDPSGELLERHMISNELVEWMYETAQRHKTHYWGRAIDSVWHSDDFPSDIRAHDWIKFGFDTEDEPTRDTIWKSLLATEMLELSNSSPSNIEVNAKGINKAAALETVCDKLGLSMNEVIAIGDSLNDMAMIQAAGCGIAMGNAQPPVKKAADWVTGTNEEDGVAQALFRFLDLES